MKIHLRAVITTWLLSGTLPLFLSAGDISYILELDETLKQEWIANVTPDVRIRSRSGSFRLHDKVTGNTLVIDKKGSPIGVNEYNSVDFCIESKPDPICREIVISDFSYDGIAGLLQGGRGERLKYIVLAECRRDENSCRYPHVKLGPNPVFKLMRKGIRAHAFSEKGKEAVVAGPYTPAEAEKRLQIIRPLVPDAFIR